MSNLYGRCETIVPGPFVLANVTSKCQGQCLISQSDLKCIRRMILGWRNILYLTLNIQNRACSIVDSASYIPVSRGQIYEVQETCMLLYIAALVPELFLPISFPLPATPIGFSVNKYCRDISFNKEFTQEWKYWRQKSSIRDYC